MATVKQKVYFLSEQQRNGLLNYLLDHPYREVAAAIQVLAQAPTTEVNIEVPDEESKDVVTKEEYKVDMNSLDKSNFEVITPSKEHLPAFSSV